MMKEQQNKVYFNRKDTTSNTKPYDVINYTNNWTKTRRL